MSTGLLPPDRVLVEDTIRSTVQVLTGNLDRYLPDAGYRAYYRWALSGANPNRDLFHRIIALTQLGNLTAAVLDRVPGPDPWPVLLRYAVPVNVYQIFEVVSDNLGIGLAGQARASVRDLLLAFNQAAIDDLRHPGHASATERLTSLRPAAAVVSAYQQSLVADEHALVAKHFPGDGSTIEYSVWSGLVANLESGRDVLARIAGTRTEPLVRARTVERYEAVRRTLIETELTRSELIDTGRQSILVTPTLGYFAAVFAEVLRPDPGYPAALDDGSLFAAFDTASLLIRLQNDVGTTLLELGSADRACLLDRVAAQHHDPGSALDLLRRAVEEPAFNRFRKDLLNGEFNLSLHGLHRIPELAAGLAEFRATLDDYARLYRQQQTLLDEQLTALGRRLHDHRILVVTRRFVDFHTELYRHRYDSLAGDYAI